MKLISRFLSVVTLLALMSSPALRAQAQDDQNYDQPEASQPEPQNDQPAPNDQANAAPSYGAETNSSSSDVNPPGRAARLQYMNGSISVQPQGTGDWIAGQLNRPLTNGDNIWADKNSRAELSVGTGVIRVDSETSLTLTNIDENVVQLELHQGAMNLHVRRLYDNEKYEVDTPNQAFTVQKPGDYRFDVDSDSDKTVITVWRGEGESTGDGPSVHIEANQQVRFTNGTTMAHDIHAAPAADAFDQWAYSRDDRQDHSASARYVSPDTVGYEDLDEYGTWKESPDYGPVWQPAVAPGWSPYYNGQWIWEYPWGWTWVEAEPWGYAPFHYGRWVWWGGYWGWAPGPVWERPYYAPALVAWFGGGGWGINFGFGFGGGFGWCPLGFGEPFIPWYHAGFGYFNQVNISNTRITNVNITNVYNNNFANGNPRPGGGIYGARNGNQLRYANMRAPNGFTAASRNTLVNSLPVARNSVRVSPNQLSRTSLTPVRTLGVQPTRTTMLGSANRGAAAPARAFSRPVVSHMTPPAGNRSGMAAMRAPQSVGRNNVQTPQISRMPNNVSRAGANGMARMPSQTGARSVPRPGSAAGAMGGRSGMGAANAPRPGNVPRSNAGAAGPMSARETTPQLRPQSVPRPPSASMSRGGETGMPRGGAVSAPRAMPSGPSGPRSNGPRSEMNVPRPPNSTAPRGFSPRAGSYQAYNQGGGSYSRSAPSYGSRSYGRSMPSYGGSPSYGRSMPSYGGSGYSRPAAPSYGGGLGSRAPSYGGSRSYGGFGGGHAPSYGGGRSSGGFGGGGHISGGGGHSGGGGGGHVSGGGGGGHSGGGSHGGHR